MITSLLVVFICKVFDCAFNTLKTVFLVKDRYFWSALCSALSMLFFIFTAQQTGMEAYVAIGVATFLGNYLPPIILNKIEGDRLHTYEITSTTLDDGKVFADKLRELNIAVSTTTVYNSDLKRVLLCKAYSTSKATSRIIEDNIPNGFKKNIVKPISQ